jgi:hypothetical protein
MPKLEQYAKQSVCLTPKFDRKKWKQKFSGLSFQLQISAWRSGTKLQRDVFLSNIWCNMSSQKFNALKCYMKPQCKSSMQKFNALNFYAKSSMHKFNAKLQCIELLYQKFNAKVQCIELLGKSSTQKFNALNFWAKVQRKSSMHWTFGQKFNAKVQCIEVLHWTFFAKSSMHWSFAMNFYTKSSMQSSMHWTFSPKVQCKNSTHWTSGLKFCIEVLGQKFIALRFFCVEIRDQNMFFVWNAGSGLIFVRFPWWNLETLKVCGELRIKLYRRKKPPTVQNDRRMCRWRMGTHHRKTFWEPSQRDKQCIFPIGITEQIGKVSTSMWYRKNWGAALCLWLRRRLNFHFFVAGFAHEFGLHSMPKIRARTQPFKNMCLAWKPIEQGFENSIHSLVMVALSQKKPWTHIW